MNKDFKIYKQIINTGVAVSKNKSDRTGVRHKSWLKKLIAISSIFNIFLCLILLVGLGIICDIQNPTSLVQHYDGQIVHVIQTPFSA